MYVRPGQACTPASATYSYRGDRRVYRDIWCSPPPSPLRESNNSREKGNGFFRDKPDATRIDRMRWRRGEERRERVWRRRRIEHGAQIDTFISVLCAGMYIIMQLRAANGLLESAQGEMFRVWKNFSHLRPTLFQRERKKVRERETRVHRGLNEMGEIKLASTIILTQN